MRILSTIALMTLFGTDECALEEQREPVEVAVDAFAREERPRPAAACGPRRHLRSTPEA
jgi:hypothetical protein